jgi:FXSXX-COOH protein
MPDETDLVPDETDLVGASLADLTRLMLTELDRPDRSWLTAELRRVLTSGASAQEAVAGFSNVI